MVSGHPVDDFPCVCRPFALYLGTLSVNIDITYYFLNRYAKYPVSGYLWPCSRVPYRNIKGEKNRNIKPLEYVFPGRSQTPYLGTFAPVSVDLTPCIWVPYTLYLGTFRRINQYILNIYSRVKLLKLLKIKRRRFRGKSRRRFFKITKTQNALPHLSALWRTNSGSDV